VHVRIMLECLQTSLLSFLHGVIKDMWNVLLTLLEFGFIKTLARFMMPAQYASLII